MLLRYPGGKQKISKIILEKVESFLNCQSEYIEPFFGGGSIGLSLFKKRKIEKAKINDKDFSLYCLWTSVLKYPDKLIEKTLSYTPEVEDFYSYKDYLIKTKRSCLEEDIIDIGFKKLVIHQISYSGLGVKSGGPLGGKEQKSKYKIDCRWNSNKIANKIQKCHILFKTTEVECTCCDFSETLNGNENTVYFLDPPYYVKGNQLYSVFFSIKDHFTLCELLKKSKSKWVLSYDDCEEIRKMYDWAKIETIPIKYTLNIGKNAKPINSEVIITKC